MHSFGAKEWADKCEQLDATIADLQGQVKEAQERLSLCEHELGSVRIDRAILQQRVAQLEGGVEEQKRNYLNACETIYKMYVAATGREGVAPKRGVVEDLAALQADHARVLGLVQALPVVKTVEIRRKIDEYDYEEWCVWLDGNPFADCETVEQANALKNLLEYRASLPAQPAQSHEVSDLIDRMAHINDGCECRICKPAQGGA